MEMLNGAVDERHIGVGSFMERINLGFVSLVGCTLIIYMGSPEMVQIITLVILYGTWVPFKSIEL